MTDPSPTIPARRRVLLLGRIRDGASPRLDADSAIELVERFPEARAVVAARGGARVPPSAQVVGVRSRGGRFALVALTRLIRDEARDADVVDADVADFLAMPMLTGALRDTDIVVRATLPRGRTQAQKRQRVRTVIDRYVYRRASAVITTNGPASRVLIERYGVSPWRVRIQPQQERPNRHSIDRSTARSRLSLPTDAFVACHVNAPVAPAEAILLLEAWSAFLGGRAVGAGARPARLLIASAGEARGALPASGVPPALADSVIVLGALDDDALADVLGASDVNVATSVTAGAESIALEAAAHGTRSIFPNNPTGGRVADPAIEVIAPDDPMALAERLAAAATASDVDRSVTRAWATQQRLDRVISERRRLYADLAGDADAPAKLRVAFVGHVAQLSGGEIALARLIEALTDHVDAHVILAEEGPLVERLHAANATVEVLPLPERTRNLRKDRIGAARLPVAAALDTLRYTLRLRRRLRAIRPALVHTNSLKAGVYGSLAGRLAGVPVVWHVRDRIASDYLRGIAVGVLRGLIRTLPAAVIVNSEATGRTLGRAGGRASAIPSPIPDTIDQPPPRWRAYGDRFVVGMVGRIAAWKGQHIFLDAFARAFGAGDEMAIIVGAPMFGAAEDAYETSLRQQVTDLGLSDRVIFRGFRADVWRELVEMDVFVHASVTPEPFGQVIIEAMMAGVPVVAAAAGGPRETITDGTDGLLYRPGDVGALASALRSLREDAVLRSDLAANARHRAAAFAPERVAADVIGVYRTVLDRHPD